MACWRNVIVYFFFLSFCVLRCSNICFQRLGQKRRTIKRIITNRFHGAPTVKRWHWALLRPKKWSVCHCFRRGVGCRWQKGVEFMNPAWLTECALQKHSLLLSSWQGRVGRHMAEWAVTWQRWVTSLKGLKRLWGRVWRDSPDTNQGMKFRAESTELSWCNYEGDCSRVLTCIPLI